jgi:antitoxin component YwqK of YwqJK toxin-antitoxin module
MSLWRRLSAGFFRRALPASAPLVDPGSERGQRRGGRKHGRWIERDERGVTTVADYEDGERHGPFRDYYPSGKRRTDGVYVEGELDGPWRVLHEDGSLAGEATFRRGKLEGRHRVLLPSGIVKLESRYVGGLPDGPWKLLHDDGTPHQRGTHDHGLRVGPWVLCDERGHVREEGSFEAGERDGPFVFHDASGRTRVAARFASGTLDGPFEVRVGDEVVAEGRFTRGVVDPSPRLSAHARSALLANPPPEPTVRSWLEIETALAALSPPTALPKSFVDLGDEPDPVDDAEYARQVESHEAWLTLFTDTTKLGATERAVVVERIDKTLSGRPGFLLPEVGYPAWHHLFEVREAHPLSRFVTSITLDHAHFDEESTRRLAARYGPQLLSLSLFECTFEPDLGVVLRGAGLRALRVLEIADYDPRARGLTALLAMDLRTQLERLAFDGAESRCDEALFAKLAACEGLERLRSLSLGGVETGGTSASALAASPWLSRLEELSLVGSRLDTPTVRALVGGATSLRRLALVRTEVPSDARETLETWALRTGARLVMTNGD